MVILLSELILFLYFWTAELEPSLKSEMRRYIFAHICRSQRCFTSAPPCAASGVRETGRCIQSDPLRQLFNLPLNLFLATELSWGVGPMTISVLILGSLDSVSPQPSSASMSQVFEFARTTLAYRRGCCNESERLGLLKRIGLPIGIHWLAEMLIFSMVGLLSGHLGTNQAAAHQIAMSIASFTFTLCLGLSSAGTVRVGLALGLDDARRARREGTAFDCTRNGHDEPERTVLLLFPRQLAALFSATRDVVELASKLVTIAAAFQIVDGLRR